MAAASQQKAEDDFCGSANTILGTIQTTVFPATFLSVLVIGLTLNCSVMWILIYRVKHWNRSAIFLCNLAVADITWILTLPCLIYYHFNHLHWIFGDAACKITRTCYHACYYCSIYFVTCLSVDRYLAIVHPHKSFLVLKKHQSLLICITIWASTGLCSTPVTYLASTQTCDNNKTTCSLYVFSNATYITLPFSLCTTTIGCVLPFVFICYCYCSSLGELRKGKLRRFQKKNTLTKLMCSALIIFGLLYLPYHASRNVCIILRAYWPRASLPIEESDAFFFIEMAVCSLNTCINPLFCFVSGGDFREQVCKLLPSFAHISSTWIPKKKRSTVHPN